MMAWFQDFRAHRRRFGSAGLEMDYTRLGRTGLKVSIIGIGAGGPSRLGLGSGNTARSAVELIRCGMDRGINVIDVAATYGTEELVGGAISGCRDQVVLSAKAALGPYFGKLDGYRTALRISARLGEVTSFVASGAEIESRLNASLRRLRTDYIDLFNLHTVTPMQYEPAVERVLPKLARLKEQGKIRWIGITEAFGRDPSHKMLGRAAADGAFDCIMIGFNLLNQSGAPIAAHAKKRGSGIIAMYAIRRKLRDARNLEYILAQLVKRGLIDKRDGDPQKITRLLNNHGVKSIAEAAIRFSRYELGADVVLTGTGNVRHLEANVIASHAGRLPEAVLVEFHRLFGKIDCVTGD